MIQREIITLYDFLQLFAMAKLLLRYSFTYTSGAADISVLLYARCRANNNIHGYYYKRAKRIFQHTAAPFYIISAFATGRFRDILPENRVRTLVYNILLPRASYARFIAYGSGRRTVILVPTALSLSQSAKIDGCDASNAARWYR